MSFSLLGDLFSVGRKGKALRGGGGLVQRKHTHTSAVIGDMASQWPGGALGGKANKDVYVREAESVNRPRGGSEI